MSDLQMSSEELTKKLILKAWSDSAFKKELIENPKAAIEKELNTKLPDDVNVKVVETDEKTILLPIPVKPKGELTEEQLESVAGGSLTVSTLQIGAKQAEVEMAKSTINFLMKYF